MLGKKQVVYSVVLGIILGISIFFLNGCVSKPDPNDQPPNIKILSPTPGSILRGIVSITVDASDDKGIKKIELYVNEKKVAEINKQPYVLSWDTKKAEKLENTLKVIAYDTAGKTAEATTNVFVIVANPNTIELKKEDLEANISSISIEDVNPENFSATLSFPNKPPFNALKEGQIIACDENKTFTSGILQRIDKKIISGDKIILKTSPATIEEAYKFYKVEKYMNILDFLPPDLELAENGASIKVSKPDSENTATKISNNLNAEVKIAKLIIELDEETLENLIKDSAFTGGSVKIELIPFVIFDISVENGLINELKIGNGISATAQVSLESKADFLERKIDLSDLQVIKTFNNMLPRIPLLFGLNIKPQIEPKLYFNIFLKGEWSASLEIVTQSGWIAKEGSVKPFYKCEANPGVNFNVGISASAGPEFNVFLVPHYLIWPIKITKIGVSIAGNCFANVGENINYIDPEEPWWKIGANLKASGKINFDIPIIKNLKFQSELVFFEKEFLFAQSPVIKIISPADNATLSGVANIIASGEAPQGINKLEVYLNDSKIGEAIPSKENPKIASLNIPLDTKKYRNGSYTIKFIATEAWFKTTQLGRQAYRKVNIANNNPPTKPGNPNPANNATNVPLNPTLSWTCSDPDGDSLTYDIYFGTSSNPPLVRSGHSTTNYAPGTLTANTVYYWKIVAKDGKGGTTEGDVWNFRTVSTSGPGTLKWKFQMDGNVWLCSPAIGQDGTVYCGDSYGYLYAINPNGTLKWRYKIGDMAESSPAIGQDGTVYVGSWDGYLYAIDPNGTLKWRYKTGSYVDSSPAIGQDGTVYVGSWDGYLYAIDPNGTLKWRYKTGNFIECSPAIGQDGTVYVGSGDFYIYAINPNGTLKWRYQTGGVVHSSPAIGQDGTVYVGSGDFYIYAINPNGTLKWRYQTGGVVFSSPAIGLDGTIYVGSNDCYVYAINPNGTLKWRYETGNVIWSSSPAIGQNGTIYVGSRDGYLYAIGSDGSLKWRYRTDSYVHSSPTIGSDGTVYVASYDRNLYAIYSDSFGLANTSWPKFKKNIRNSGRFGDN